MRLVVGKTWRSELNESLIKPQTPVLNETELLHVTFYFAPGLGLYEIEKRFTFWSSPEAREWFKARGYTLYERCWEEDMPILDTSIPAIPSQSECGEAEYPYPHFDTDCNVEPDEPDTPLRARDMTGKAGFGQDVLGRHVAIKIVRADTEEYHILRFLHEQSLDTLKEHSIIPILELIPNGTFWFVVMPRWAMYIDRPKPKYIHEIVFIVHSLLKGLQYLNANNIAHGDIGAGNFLVNHITDDCMMPRRGHLRAEKRLLYALFDFDLSIIPPPGTDINDFRLPAERSYGSFNKSNDTSTGEFDYNPFVLDVGSMGVFFCRKYQHITDRLPLLAPILDMMTHRNLKPRFSAAEVLRFFEDRVAELSDAELAAEIRPIKDRVFITEYDDYDRWENLPPLFVERFKEYRATPVPWCIRFLRRFCATDFGGRYVPKIRYFMFTLSSIPSAFCKRLLPEKIALK